jgi:hypothetical protein
MPGQIPSAFDLNIVCLFRNHQEWLGPLRTILSQLEPSSSRNDGAMFTKYHRIWDAIFDPILQKDLHSIMNL